LEPLAQFLHGAGGIYNRSVYEREVRAALALWADHVRALVKGGERKIVPLKEKLGEALLASCGVVWLW